MYYYFNALDSSPSPGGVLDTEALSGSSGVSAAAGSFSGRAKYWLDTLARPGMWCDPAAQHRLMCALGTALLRAPGFPEDHGVLMGDCRGDEPLLHERQHAPRFVLLSGRDGNRRRPDHALRGFLMLGSGEVPGGTWLCGTGGDAFFKGLVDLMQASGHLHGLLSQHRLRAGRTEDMLRELLVAQLAKQSPDQCETLASDMGLWWTDDQARQSPVAVGIGLPEVARSGSPTCQQRAVGCPSNSPPLSLPWLPVAPFDTAHHFPLRDSPPRLSPHRPLSPSRLAASPELATEPRPCVQAEPLRGSPRLVAPPRGPGRAGEAAMAHEFMTTHQWLSELIDAIYAEDEQTRAGPSSDGAPPEASPR